MTFKSALKAFIACRPSETPWCARKAAELKRYFHCPFSSVRPIAIVTALVVPFVVLPLTTAYAQRGGTVSNVDGRLSELQRSVANLNAQLEQLKAQDRRLQQKLEDMQTRLGQRLERLETGKAAKPVPRAAGPKRQAKQPKPNAKRN
jgi:TolA-binding protein